MSSCHGARVSPARITGPASTTMPGGCETRRSWFHQFQPPQSESATSRSAAFTRSVVFDEEGNLWLELAKNAETKGFTYDVFSPEGVFLKQVAIDQRIRQFKGGRIYCLVESEEGFHLAKRFRMELKPEAAS